MSIPKIFRKKNLNIDIHSMRSKIIISLLCVGKFQKLYNENLPYKKYILDEGVGLFKQNLMQCIKAILSAASLSLSFKPILFDIKRTKI